MPTNHAGMTESWLDVADRTAFARAVGQTLRTIRVSLGWRLADAAQLVGLSPSQLCRLELGARPIGMGRLVLLCGALGIAPSEVIATAERDAFPLGWPAQNLASHSPAV
ncbi:MAG TPA: helix-turn-helix transcriptional regulator [Pseudonocardiaceae bacterium]|jgi:transcriptional regulator with XRE-family HTH domain|nr:helix-turn-helix transcriptional regulator [Pseudonocardiaceae bacterium]